MCRYHLVLDPVLTEIKKLKSVRKQAHTGAFTREKILEKTRKYLVPARRLPPYSEAHSLSSDMQCARGL